MEGWLARDWDNSLWFFKAKPYKNKQYLRWDADRYNEEIEEVHEETEETRNISWEDEEPTKVKVKYEIVK